MTLKIQSTPANVCTLGTGNVHPIGSTRSIPFSSRDVQYTRSPGSYARLGPTCPRAGYRGSPTSARYSTNVWPPARRSSITPCILTYSTMQVLEGYIRSPEAPTTASLEARSAAAPHRSSEDWRAGCICRRPRSKLRGTFYDRPAASTACVVGSTVLELVDGRGRGGSSVWPPPPPLPGHAACIPSRTSLHARAARASEDIRQRRPRSACPEYPAERLGVFEPTRTEPNTRQFGSDTHRCICRKN
ncbi:hypothetical protein C8Q77DRAFT_224243 [Trametes polyzona]|nr:hypothetical protein C8Q77DRAFT_224243 [Trametes polyzona]